MGLRLLEVGFALVDNSSGDLVCHCFMKTVVPGTNPGTNPYYRHIFRAQNTIAGTCEARSKQRSTVISSTIKHCSHFKCKTAVEGHHFKALGNGMPIKTGYTAILWPLCNLAKGFKFALTFFSRFQKFVLKFPLYSVITSLRFGS